MDQDILEKIERLCSFICNGKNYQYEQKLYKSAEHKLYDAGIIYAWNIFMLFVYEKVWQIREVEKLDEGDDFRTDKVFLTLTKNKPSDYFDGNLFSLNKLSENKQGEDAIIGKLKEVYSHVDQQIFREAQQILQKRNISAHVNSINIEAEDLQYVLRELIKITEAIQEAHNNNLQSIFDNLEKYDQWHLSEIDLLEIHKLFDKDTTDICKYRDITKLIKTQKVSDILVDQIKKRAIRYFLQSHSYESAYNNGITMILPILQFLNENNIKEILTGVFENIRNQILDARKIEDVFIELYQLSSNNFPELEENWKEFVQKLKEGNYDNTFEKLILEIENKED